MKTPVIQITEPRSIEKMCTENFGITYYDYSDSHLIYKGEDLGSMEDIKNMVTSLQELNNMVITQANVIDKLTKKNKSNKNKKVLL